MRKPGKLERKGHAELSGPRVAWSPDLALDDARETVDLKLC